MIQNLIFILICRTLNVQGRQSINEMATVIQRAWRLYKIRKDEKEKKEKFSTMKKLSTLPVMPATPPSQTVTSVRRSRSYGFFYLFLRIQ